MVYHLHFKNLKNNIDGVLVVTIPLLIYLFIVTLNTLMLNLKTIKMNSDGVEISFLYFKKNYNWCELKIRKCEDFSWYIRINEKFEDKPTHCVIFSKNIINKSKSLSPFHYATKTTPFKSFDVIAISLVDANVVYPELCYSNFNLISKNEFLTKMKKWNIEIEGIHYKRN